jgi:hypothetical protein
METLAKQNCWQGYLTRDGFVPERYSSQIKLAMPMNRVFCLIFFVADLIWVITVFMFHLHILEMDGIQYFVERDGVPGVVGQADQGVARVVPMPAAQCPVGSPHGP